MEAMQGEQEDGEREKGERNLRHESETVIGREKGREKGGRKTAKISFV